MANKPKHASWLNCQLPVGEKWATVGGCKHPTAEGMSRADFGKLPLVRCADSECGRALGRICPDCDRVY